MVELVQLGEAEKGDYEDEELLDLIARLPDHHRQVFEKLLELLREIDLAKAGM